MSEDKEGTLLLIRFPASANEDDVKTYVKDYSDVQHQIFRTRTIPGRGGRPSRGNELYLYLLVLHNKNTEIFKERLNEIKEKIKKDYPTVTKDIKVWKKKVKKLPTSIQEADAMNIDEPVKRRRNNNNNNNKGNNGLENLIGSFGSLGFNKSTKKVKHSNANSTVNNLLKNLKIHGGRKTRKLNKRR
jgi:phenylalanyl-tRNA synthetase alpha subunit